MIMKQLFQKMLMAAAVVVLGLGMGSCADNIDNSTTPSEKEQQEQQAQDAKQAKAQKFWAVVGQLVDVDDYTDDYEDKTFESTYGVSQGTDGTRYVFTNTAAAAAARFADLVECDDIDETTETYTYDDPDVGTLVYTKGTGRELATVEVRVKQIPTLKKIVYVPGSYANGNFQGRAYYRFGDVVKRTVTGYPNGDVTEYWICVRPSFGPESKGDSHWVCLNVLPKKNVWNYKASNQNEYWLPTGLGTNKEQMQNLAEMLYAIFYPDEWKSNIEYASGVTDLTMFHDFDLKKDSLHNQYFWKNVQTKWREKEILKFALNYDGTDNEFRNEVLTDLRLLYNGYSWYKSVSWKCTLYEAQYLSDDPIDPEQIAPGQHHNPVGVNMHKVRYYDTTKNMQEMPSIDCRRTGKGNNDEYYNKYIHFFNEKPQHTTYYWTVRHATGKELASNGKYNKKEKIEGVEDVYRYYNDVIPNANLDEKPEVTPAPDDEGDDDNNDEDNNDEEED